MHDTVGRRPLLNLAFREKRGAFLVVLACRRVFLPMSVPPVIAMPSGRLRVGQCVVDVASREVHAPGAKRPLRLAPKSLAVADPGAAAGPGGHARAAACRGLARYLADQRCGDPGGHAAAQGVCQPRRAALGAHRDHRQDRVSLDGGGGVGSACNCSGDAVRRGTWFGRARGGAAGRRRGGRYRPVRRCHAPPPHRAWPARIARRCGTGRFDAGRATTPALAGAGSRQRGVAGRAEPCGMDLMATCPGA